MSFGKLYGYIGNPRTTVPYVVAKSIGLDIEVVETGSGKFTDEFLALFPVKKIPAFVGADGLVLNESIAIAIYFASQKEESGLLGKSKADLALILKWMSFTNMEAFPRLGSWWRPLAGREPYNKKSVDKAIEETELYMSVYEKHLAEHTWLVGERFTLADLYAAMLFSRGFEHVFGTAWREAHPAISRWFTTVVNQSIWLDVLGAYTFIDEPIKYTPPKKEPAPKKEQPKKEAPKKKAAEDEEEEEEKSASKPKHPLEALGPAKLPLDSWKRQYSNEDTRPVALPWFWENYDPEEYSLWKVKYKYDEELTLTFMSANLIGGFFNRLSASTKYLFGCLVVYGENNSNGIVGAFLVRGQDYAPAFDVAPDWESYEFIKLDASKPEDKEFVEDMWAWDKPVVADGVSKEIADGKVFK
ncbi:EF1Bgamma1 [Lipomyces orientalis]|uniref:EF1Bgamma1 n=1 Tax=Lipomyces orientalis TaxID=1233043 RepID=A0ACC3TJ75_9ASCO